MIEGPLAALAAIESATGQKEANAIGYCLGGTLLAATLACMRKSGDDRIKAATFFTSMIDFEEPGELGVFIDDDQLAFIDEKMKERGYLDGSEMATTSICYGKRPHMVIRYKQLSYGQGALPLRFVVLNLDPPACQRPHVLPAQMYREQPVGFEAVNTMDTDVDLSVIDIPTLLSTRKTISHLEINVRRRRFTWTGNIYLSGFRPHRRRHPPELKIRF